ncbi:MAG: PilZ domain-containing protein [Candidatus Sulfotelmatobacter sp.]
MTTPLVQVERRVGQRFPYLLPVSVRQLSGSIEGVGITQDLSSRGVFLITEVPLTEGAEVDLTLQMPSEITLGESMPVRCRGHVLRVVRQIVSGNEGARADSKIGVAVRLETYEYLATSSQASASFERVATLHHDHPEDRPSVRPSIRPVAG